MAKLLVFSSTDPVLTCEKIYVLVIVDFKTEIQHIDEVVWTLCLSLLVLVVDEVVEMQISRVMR